MKEKMSFVLVFALLVGWVVLPQPAEPEREAAYVEPALLLLKDETLSVIVTGDDSVVAARAVEQVGGQVTSSLCLIDAVGAQISARRLEALTMAPGIRYDALCPRRSG